MNRYKATIKVRQTGTTAAAEPVWAMRLLAGSSRLVHVTRMYVAVSFDGTAAATTSSYTVERYDDATMTGGTGITSAAVGTGVGVRATDMTDIRFLDTGLTDTGIANVQELANIGCPRGTTGTSVLWDLTDLCYLSNILGTRLGEGLAIVLNEAAVVGDALRGFVEWTETDILTAVGTT